jgi:hypothetical protein
MHKYIILVLTISVVSIISCKKKSSDTSKVETSLIINQEGIKEIPSTPAFSISWPVDLKDTLEDQLDATLVANGVTKNQISKVYAKSMEVDIVGLGQTFDFIDDSVKIYVNKIGSSSPILVASKKGIQLGATSISLDVIKDDVKDIFLSDSRELILRFNSRPNQGIGQGTKFHYKMQFLMMVFK